MVEIKIWSLRVMTLRIYIEIIEIGKVGNMQFYRISQQFIFSHRWRVKTLQTTNYYWVR